MRRLQGSESKMRKLLPAFLSPTKLGGAFKGEADATIVRLSDSPPRPPETPIEERLVSTLKAAGAISVVSLVERVAAELYADELRKGAGVLDIGLIGDRLFHRDIIRELNAANGILWEMK